MARPIKRLESVRAPEICVPLVGVGRDGSGGPVVVLASWATGAAVLNRETAEAFRALLSAACEEASLMEARAIESRGRKVDEPAAGMARGFGLMP